MRTNDKLFYKSSAFWSYFFPISCLKVGGAAYPRVRLIHKSLRYLLLHSCIRIIMWTCPDNINVISQVCKKSSAEIMRACKITKITMMRGQYYFNWNLPSLSVCSCLCEDSRVPPLNRYWNISTAEDLYCLKVVYRNFVQNWAGVSKQIANNVLFWLCLSEILARQCLLCKWCFAAH